MDIIYPIINPADENLPFYVTGVGCQKSQDYINRPSGFTDYQWAYCRHGKGVFEVGGEEYPVSEKAAFFFRPGVTHKYYPVEEPWEVCWITFKGKGLTALMDYLSFGDWEFVTLPKLDYPDNILENVASLLKTGKRLSAQECSVLLYSFLFRMKDFIEVAREKTRPYKLETLKVVTDYMEKNYSSDLTLPEMAELAGISPAHLCRVFKKHFNVSVITYLTYLRIQKSKELLTISPVMGIAKVAEKSGFKDASYFCHIFRKMEGITPNAFRGM